MKYQKRVTSETGYYVLEGSYNRWFKEVVAMMLAYDENKRASFAQIKEKIQKDEKMLLLNLEGSGITNNNISKENYLSKAATLTSSIIEIIP